MRRAPVRRIALVGVVGVSLLMWPGQAGAGTTLGGYSGSAQALPLRIQVYEPVIPIPSTPQIDGGIALSRATTDTGPVSRALASYLWPGDTVGDGFGQLVGGDAKYPVQVNSRYPSAPDSPPTNAAQLTDGNGMSTSSSETTTKATVTGLGVAGPGVDLTGGLLKGLGQLTGQTPAQSSAGTDVPVPVGGVLSGLGTVEGVHSQSTVTVGHTTLTSSAHAQAGTVSLLGGLVALGGVDATSFTTSNGTRATATGTTTLGSLSVAGIKADFGAKGLTFGGSHTEVPALPSAITNVLAELGLQLKTFVTTRSVHGATSSQASTGLELTVDTGKLKQSLGVGAVLDTVGTLLSQIPDLGDELGPLLGLGPKIVFRIGDVSSSVTASPQYLGTGTPGGSGSTTAPPAATSARGGGSVSTGATGGGTFGSGTTGGGGAPVVPAAQNPVVTSPVATGYDLPGLGAVPKALILGGLIAALAVAWLLSTVGATLFGAARGCDDGLASGVPDLRKGRP